MLLALMLAGSSAWGAIDPGGRDPMDVLRAVGAAYEGLTRYHLVAQAGVRHDDGVHDPVESETRLVFAYGGDGKMRAEISGSEGSVILVSDGGTLWQYLPTQSEYTRQDTADLPTGAAETIVLGFTAQYMGIADSVATAHIVDHETTEMGDREVDAIVIELTYKEGETPPEMEGVMKRVWIDSTSHLVVREEFTMHHPTSDGGSVRSDSTLNLVRADVGEAVDDALFTFTPPDGATEVEPGASDEPEQVDLTGAEAADFTLNDGDGNAVTLSALRGRVVLLDFWATWCGPCRVVMPIIQKLHDEYADKGVAVYGVNNEEPTLVREFLTENGYSFPTLRDPRSAAFMLYEATGIPTTVVVGREGTIVAYLVGVHREEAYRAALARAGID